MPRKRYQYVYKGQKVHFLDTYHGFWRNGECYKEDKKMLWIRDIAGSRYRVPNDGKHCELLVVKPNDESNRTGNLPALPPTENGISGRKARNVRRNKGTSAHSVSEEQRFPLQALLGI